MEVSLFSKICGAALLVAIVSVVLSELPRGTRLPVKVSGAVLLYGGVLLLIVPLITALRRMTEGYALAPYGELMLKCLGIALLSEIVSDLCRDAGEGTVGGLVEIAAKALILLLALPTVESLLDIVKSLLGT